MLFATSCVLAVFVAATSADSDPIGADADLASSPFAEPNFDDDDIPVVEGRAQITIPVDEHGVVLLDKSLFFHVLNTNDVVLVEFYAPWCGHCRSLEPEYARAAELLRDEKRARLAKVDATVEEALAKEYGVTGFPTMMLFVKGVKIEDYSGPRNAHAIVDYVREKADPDWQPPPSSVVPLTESNFTAFVKKSKLTLVEFYAPWCGHCKKLVPELEEAAKQLRDDRITLAKVDGTVEKALADEYNVKGWPTLFLFRSGRAFEYKGGRDSAGIVSYMRDMQKLPSVEIKSAKDLKNNLPRLAAAVVGVFDDSDAKDLREEFFSASYIAKGEGLEAKFFHSSDPEVARFIQGSMNQIVIVKPELLTTEHEPERHSFGTKSSTASDIVAAVKEHSTPLVGYRTKRNAAQEYRRRPLVVAYFDVNYAHEFVADTERVRQMVAGVAKDYVGEVQFAVSGENEFADELKMLGLDDSGEDVNVGCWAPDGVKYAMEPTDNLGAEELREFVENVIAGKMKPYLRSQLAPKSQPGPVHVLVASTFEAELSQDRDFLVEFYAPWCGHCKKLEPVIKKLAENNRARAGNLVVAKFDATQNDVPRGFKVDGYPTVYFVPAGKRDAPVKYSMKERTVEALQRFLDENSSVFLSDAERAGTQPVDRDEL